MDHMHWAIFASLLGCTIALKSTTGREFVTGFPCFGDYCALRLDIASSTNGNVYVYVPYLDINKTYSFNRTLSITEGKYGYQSSDTIQNGIYIKSTVDVSVYVTTYLSTYEQTVITNNEDTHVCLSVQSLEREYYISSYMPKHGSLAPSVFMVISAYENTEVNITFVNSTSISKTLNWFDVYQATSPSNDLTGTIVHSSKPVSVVSGVTCTNAAGPNDCDSVFEQMIPTNAFQTDFIVPPVLSNPFMVRIFSSQSNNKVCVKDASFENCTTMGSNKWLESAPKHSPLVITSQEPISVIQYNELSAYMTIIPGICQFMNSYTFVVPKVFDTQTHFISVTILASASQTLRLDGKPPSIQLIDGRLVSGQLADTAKVEPPLNYYTVLTFKITEGYHVMTSTDTHVMFGLIVFGIGPFNSHGYPAGINFDVGECSSSPCHYNSTCSNGVNGYTCPAGFTGRNCDTSLVSGHERGPWCIDCKNVRRIEDCKYITQCDKHQSCTVEEFHYLDWQFYDHQTTQFILGCVNSPCGDIGNGVPRCKSCCDQDFCNTNCTNHQSIGIIG